MRRKASWRSGLVSMAGKMQILSGCSNHSLARLYYQLTINWIWTPYFLAFSAMNYEELFFLLLVDYEHHHPVNKFSGFSMFDDTRGELRLWVWWPHAFKVTHLVLTIIDIWVIYESYAYDDGEYQKWPKYMMVWSDHISVICIYIWWRWVPRWPKYMMVWSDHIW